MASDFFLSNLHFCSCFAKLLISTSSNCRISSEAGQWVLLFPEECVLEKGQEKLVSYWTSAQLSSNAWLSSYTVNWCMKHLFKRFVHQTIIAITFLRRILTQLLNLDKQGVLIPDVTLYKARHIYHLLRVHWLLTLFHCLLPACRPEEHAVSQT